MAKAPNVSVDLGPFIQATKVISAAIAMSLDSADGVTLPQLRALAMVERRGPLNMSTMAEGLGVNPSNASRACDQLVARGLIERRDDAVDRRSTVLTLTTPGRKLLDAMMKHRRAVLAAVVERMSQQDQEALYVAMSAFTAAADELAETGELLSDGDGRVLRWLG